MPYFQRRLMRYVYYPDGKVYYQESGSGTNPVRTAFDYHERDQISSVNVYRVSPAQRYTLRSYWRDGRDRITAWGKSNAPAYNPLENGRGDRYAYDWEGQLFSVWYQALDPGGNPSNPQRVEWFDYDKIGNRKGDGDAIAGRGWVNFIRRDNGLNQYVRWTPSSIFYDDNATWSGGYPNNGVLVQQDGVAMTFNALNQPIALNAPARLPSGNYLWFAHDPLGRCVKRWISPSSNTFPSGATYFYYDGWNLIQEGPTGANATRIYAHGNRVDEIVADYNYNDNQFRYHHYDARGHCILLTNQIGNLIEQYDYDAFGQPYFYTGGGTVLPNGTAEGNRFLFTGREWLAELRGYDYRNRLYMPQLGRFLQPDPKHFLAGDYNLYRYCHNDPVNRTDPMGLTWRVAKDLQKEFNAARAYLSQDPGMKKTFDAIAAHKMNVFVHRTASLAPGGTKTSLVQNRETGEVSVKISWNPNAALSVNGGSQSPALVLGHESSHGERYITDPKGAIRDTNISAVGFKNQEERRVITGPEAAAAKTLGETPRTDNRGVFYYVNDPTDR